MSHPCQLSAVRRHVSEAGVTITELMVVVGIVAIAAALAVPNFRVWNARYQLKQAVTELHSNLNMARMSAMNRNTTVRVQLAAGVVDPADGRQKITATFIDAAGVVVFLPQRMNTEVRTMAGANLIQFNSRGLRAGGGTGIQTITLTNSQGLSYEIQVTAAGKARWCPISPCP
jgi:type IV fimbrial biogenesis protein FimT